MGSQRVNSRSIRSKLLLNFGPLLLVLLVTAIGALWMVQTMLARAGHEHEQWQVRGRPLPADRAEPEHGHDVPPARREPAEGANRQRVEAQRDDPGREAAQDRDGREQWVGAGDVVRTLDRQAPRPEQQRCPDGDGDEGQLQDEASRRHPEHGR